MEFLMGRWVLVYPALIVLLIFTGCAKSYRVSRDSTINESPWPFVRGEAVSDGYYPGGSFSGKLDILWERKEPDKPVGPLTIYNGALVYSGTKKKIKFFDLYSGKKLGRIKSRGQAQSGAIARDSMLYFAVGPKKNHLNGFNLFKYKLVWKHPVKDAGSGSILVENRLIVSSGDGIVLAVDPLSGETLWRFEAKEKFLAPPSYDEGLLIQPGDGGSLFVLSIEDGSLIRKVSIGGPLLGSAAISGLVYIADMPGSVYAVDPRSGEIVWQTQLGGPIWSALAVANSQVIVGHSGGMVVALNAETGEVNWRFKTGEVVKAAPLIVGDRIIVGTALGTVFCLDAETGAALSTYKLDGGIVYPPVTDGSRVFIATQRGRIACFGENNDQIRTANHRINSEEGSE